MRLLFFITALLITGNTIAQATAKDKTIPMTMRLDGFYKTDDPAKRIAIYHASLTVYPDTGTSIFGYNVARSVVAKEFAQAGNVQEAEKWLSLLQGDGYALQAKLKVAEAMYQRGETTYAENKLRPLADSLYRLFSEHRKQGSQYNQLLVVYVPVLKSRQESGRIVHYLAPLYKSNGNFFYSDKNALALTKREKYDLDNNLSVQYAKALAATGQQKKAIEVLALLKAGGAYDGAKLDMLIDSCSKGKRGNNAYADRLADSLRREYAGKLKSFLQYKRDGNGNKIDWDKMNARYILLDFWGSWCKPCRASHPHLKELYAGYKDKGFEIIGIAKESGNDLATQKKTWKTAIQQDGLLWMQVLNNENQKQFDAVAAYKITAFPTKILLDKEGNIVATFIGNTNGGPGLEAILRELLGEPGKEKG